jgi:hypothetical protein
MGTIGSTSSSARRPSITGVTNVEGLAECARVLAASGHFVLTDLFSLWLPHDDPQPSGSCPDETSSRCPLGIDGVSLGESTESLRPRHCQAVASTYTARPVDPSSQDWRPGQCETA